MQKQRAFIIGAGGMVGATIAQTLAVKEIVHDIVLIDIADELVHGQAMDIGHATAYTNGVHVRVGSYGDIKKNDIIIITCGLPQNPGQTRLELLEANGAIIRDVVAKVMAQGEPVYIVMVSNPVDVLTHVALEVSSLPKHRVFGTGTTLDTARLRVALAHELHVSQQQVSGYIMGEHGDSSFAALSSATIGGIPLADFPGFKPAMVQTIEQDVRDAAYKIIEAKRSTYYGIGNAVATIVEAMTRDRATILPVCSMTTGEYGLDGVVLGLPSLISAEGVRVLDKYPLSEAEQERLMASAAAIKEATVSVMAEKSSTMPV